MMFMGGMFPSLAKLHLGEDYVHVETAVGALVKLEQRGVISRERFEALMGSLVEEVAEEWLAKQIAGAGC
jgi:hypothetical protein